MEKIIINIAKDFSETPGPRYQKDGEFSGEEFREKVLVPKYNEAVEKKVKLEINLDGGYGYPPSFLEEAFGGLVRKFGKEEVVKTLEFVSLEEPYLLETIQKYMEKAI
ncbi:MAG: STAS-like domain-containing protein [Clostridia bacterium]|nr:STAS-like domain-containing protein [Clostridia bacterium]